MFAFLNSIISRLSGNSAVVPEPEMPSHLKRVSRDELGVAITVAFSMGGKPLATRRLAVERSLKAIEDYRRITNQAARKSRKATPLIPATTPEDDQC